LEDRNTERQKDRRIERQKDHKTKKEKDKKTKRQKRELRPLNRKSETDVRFVEGEIHFF
jgi:hypothetical protein